MVFNLIAKLLKWYDMNPDKKVNTLYTSASLWMSVVGGLTGLGLFGIFNIPIFQSWNFILLYCFICGFLITATELGSGFIFNIKFKLDLWDYSKEPLNYRGQISIFRSSCWVLSGIIVFLMGSSGTSPIANQFSNLITTFFAKSNTALQNISH